MYAFNFNTPPGLRVCNRLSALSGTASEFFGFTEISFPSYEVGTVDPSATAACARDSDCAAGLFCEKLGFSHGGGPACVRAAACPRRPFWRTTSSSTNIEMEKLESGLVKVSQMRISNWLGPDIPGSLNDGTFAFSANASNCDVNGDGQIDFFDDDRSGLRQSVLVTIPSARSGSAYDSRGNYKVSRGSVMIQVNTGTAQGFDPTKHKGASRSGPRHWHPAQLLWRLAQLDGRDALLGRSRLRLRRSVFQADGDSRHRRMYSPPRPKTTTTLERTERLHTTAAPQH